MDRALRELRPAVKEFLEELQQTPPPPPAADMGELRDARDRPGCPRELPTADQIRTWLDEDPEVEDPVFLADLDNPRHELLAYPAQQVPALILAALRRWGCDPQLQSKRIAGPRPASTPIPVSERPWEQEGWLNAEQQCWLFDCGYSYITPPSWELVHGCELEIICSTKKVVWCLPHWAIAIPHGDHFPGARKMVEQQEYQS